MPRALILSCALLAFAPLAASPCLAQDAPAEPPPTALQTGISELIEVSEVSLDVLATTRDGEPALGLGAGDFVVEEEGVPVEITGVHYYASRYAEPGAAQPGAGEVPGSRYLIFTFHDQASSLSDGPGQLSRQIQAAREAMRWVETEMSPSDWAAVTSYDVALEIHQDFTQDRAALLAALDRAAAGKAPEGFKRGRREAVARGRELKILSRLAEDPALTRQTRNLYEGLQKLAEATGFLVGRKILMLYTVGFGIRQGQSWRVDERYYPALETVLNDHNVAVYPVDLSPPGRPPLQEDFLQRLADDSGGVYDPNFSGYLTPLRKIADANPGYYLLTYRSQRPAGAIGYQRVKVKAKDTSLRLLTRKGYRYGL